MCEQVIVQLTLVTTVNPKRTNMELYHTFNVNNKILTKAFVLYCIALPHINFIECCQHCTSILGILEALSNAQSHTIHFHLQHMAKDHV